MKIIKTINYISMIMIFTVSCGFQVINIDEFTNFKIAKIETAGNERINFKIKNKISIYSKENSNNLIQINLESKKNKNVKERNIKNEITKYKIDIAVKVSFNKINKEDYKTFLITKNADYQVQKQYSETLNNEKRVIRLLTDEIADQIVKELVLRLDDL